MSRKPSNVTTTSKDEEKILDVVDNAETKTADTADNTSADTKTDKKAKEIKDDDKVKICRVAGKATIVTTDYNNPIVFDDKGIAEVSGIEAKRFLTIPGYKLA